VYNIIRPSVFAILSMDGKEEKPLTAYTSNETGDIVSACNRKLTLLYPTGGNANRKLTSHALRKVYANWSFDEYGFRRMSRNAWITSVLGHDKSSMTSSLSYTGARFERLLQFSDKPTDLTMLTNELVDLKAEFKLLRESLGDRVDDEEGGDEPLFAHVDVGHVPVEEPADLEHELFGSETDSERTETDEEEKEEEKEEEIPQAWVKNKHKKGNGNYAGVQPEEKDYTVKKSTIPMRAGETKDKGLFTDKKLKQKAGKKLMEFTGEVISKDTLDARYPGDKLAEYAIEVDPKKNKRARERRFIDARDANRSSKARWISDPKGTNKRANVEFVSGEGSNRGKVFVELLGRAKGVIAADRELLAGYGPSYGRNKKKQKR